MKTFNCGFSQLLLLVFLLGVTSTYSQSPCKVDTTYQSILDVETGEVALIIRTTSHYNDVGDIESFLSELSLGFYSPPQFDKDMKGLYLYNENNDLLEELIFSWESYQWLETELNRREYDSQGNLIYKISSQWNSNHDAWELQSDVTYSYDDKGNLIDEIERNRYYDPIDNKSSIINSGRILKYFNDQNQLSNDSYFYWDDLKQLWILDFGADYTYNDKGQVIEVLYTIGDEEGNEIQDEKIHSTYNNQGEKTRDSIEIWMLDAWILHSKKTYNFDRGNNYSKDLTERWVNEEWTLSSLSTYEYNANNKLILTLNEIWQNDEWIPRSKSEQTYDDQDHILENRYFNWSTTKNSWFPVMDHNSYTYDESYMKSREIWSYDFNGNLKYHNLFSFICGEKFTTTEYVNFYDVYNVYPNPTNNDYIKIETPAFTDYGIYNLKGELIKHNPLNIGVNTISTAGIHSGVYILKVGNNSTKLIVK